MDVNILVLWSKCILFFSNIRVCNSCTFDTYMPIMISNFGIIAMFLENAFIGCLTFLANVSTVCK